MEIFLTFNIYFTVILTVGSILKKNYSFFRQYNYLDLYLYIVLYSTVLLIFLSVFDIINQFHIISLLCITVFLLINLNKLFHINFKKLFNALLILNLILIICLNMEFIWWDEFSSWGLRTKEILINNSIYYEGMITNANKPSGSSLLHYIFLKYLDYHEGAIIFCQTSIAILLLNNILCDFKIQKNYTTFITLFLIIYFLSFILNYGIFSIYTGLITSIIFIKILSILFINNKDYKVIIFEVTPLVFLILFLKDFSLFYILYVLIVFFVKFLDFKKFKLNLNKFIIFLIPLVITILLQKIILIKQQTKNSLVNNDFFEIINFIANTKIDLIKLSEINIYQAAFLRIPNKILEKTISVQNFFTEFKVNIFVWLVLFFIINIIYYFSNKKNYRDKLDIFLTLFSINIIHLILILISYNIFFGANEAQAMASFGRYIGLYFMPYIIILVLFGLSEFKIFEKIKYFLVVFFISISPAKSIEILIPSNFNNFNSNLKEIIRNKNEIKSISNFIKLNYEKSSVYILVDGDDGFYHNLFKFYMYPLNINSECWDFSKNLKKQNFNYSCNFVDDIDLKKKLLDYNLIINFKKSKKYNDIFKNDKFYKFKDLGNSNIYLK